MKEEEAQNLRDDGGVREKRVKMVFGRFGLKEVEIILGGLGICMLHTPFSLSLSLYLAPSRTLPPSLSVLCTFFPFFLSFFF